MADPTAPLVAFGRELRSRGLPVGTGRILTFVRALYWAGRVSLVASRADLDAYDDAFEAWYRSLGADRIGVSFEDALSEPSLPVSSEELDDPTTGTGLTAGTWRSAADDDEPEPGDASAIRIVASAVEVLRSKSFADLTEDERRRVARMIHDLTVRPPVERTRRTRTSPKGSTFDLRRTLRRSLRTQGEPFDRSYRVRRSRTS